jgi:hypothetical protein
MARSFLLIPLFTLALLVIHPREAQACPACRDGVAADSDNDEATDGARLALAYNASIYLLVGMPYFLLGTVSFLVYRGLKQKARAEHLAAEEPRPADGGLDDVQLTQSPGICP